MNSSQRYLITKMAGLAERPDPSRFVKGANVGKNFMQDFIDGAKQNPRLGFIQSSNDGTMHKVAAANGAIQAVRNFMGNEHKMELAGLAALGIPAAYHGLTAKDPADKAMSGVELGGLGMLALPAVNKLRHR